MDRDLVAKRLADRLFKTEETIDDAIVQINGLVNEIIEAQTHLGVSRTVANDTVAKLLQAATSMSEARTRVVSGHHRMDQLRETLGIRTKLSGIQFKENQPMLSADDEQKSAAA